MRLGKKSTRNEQKRQKFIKTFSLNELNSNWLETLRFKWNHWESLLYLNRERLRPSIIQDMSNDYKMNKYRQAGNICTKNFARKRCHLNQLNNKLITKNNKNLRLHFLQVTTFVSQLQPIIVILWKENKNLQKSQICKNHENWLCQEERPFEERKTVMRSKLFFKR